MAYKLEVEYENLIVELVDDEQPNLESTDIELFESHFGKKTFKFDAENVQNHSQVVRRTKNTIKQNWYLKTNGKFILRFNNPDDFMLAKLELC